eukprot:TRINITY_DN6483_c0_g1_i1.p1 TRINITY_DN6483_c0_g1~~TRINITY_DN6483_c0_g1_i1.p1  ORF type:complete len:1139 (+),score=327.57 TRINITY_DN6483_c0_g1_i1:3791-7207(+)
MLPPTNVLNPEGEEEEGLSSHFTFRKAMKIIRSREMQIIVLGTIFITLIVGLQLIVSYGWFHLCQTVVIVLTCAMIWATFLFSQSAFMDGFFMILGTGYLFVGVIILFAKGVALGTNVVDIGGRYMGNVFLQLDIISRVIEVVSWGVGLIFAHRSFKSGVKLLVSVTLFWIVFCTLSLLAIFKWNIFPLVATREPDPNGGVIVVPSTFRNVVAALWIPEFIAIFIFLCFRRKYFTDTVFVFLSLALFLRIVNVIVNAVLQDLSVNDLQVAQYLTKMASFCFIYFSVGTSVLRDPLKTLYYALNLKRIALENQTQVISWMIDQVPSICILLDDNLTVTHVNKFGNQKLKLSPRAPLLNDEFLNFVHFESDAKRSDIKQQIHNLVHNRSQQNYVIFSTESTTTEANKVIEWTLKLVRSNSGLAQSSSGTSSANSSDLESGSLRSETEGTGTSNSQVTVLCLGRDVTDEMESQELLKEARYNAERLALMQENFVANTSHELRTPLNCIVGVTDLLMMQEKTESEGEMISMIRTSANSLLALINDLLEFAKLKQGQMKLSYGPIRLRSFVRNCVESMSVLYEKSGIDLCYWISRDCPEIFDNDENRLRQILFNLLSNAVKFTKKGQIIVTIKLTAADGTRKPSLQRYLKFTVADSGVGMSESDLQNLFTRFFQAERGRSQKAGTGIGLSISKQIVELMGGTISVDSKLGSGSTFSFVIPLESSTYKSPEGVPLSGSSYSIFPENLPLSEYTNENHYVLICLRNPSVSNIISSALIAEYGFQCKTCGFENALNDFLVELSEGRTEHWEGIPPNINRISILLNLKDSSKLNTQVLHILQEKGIFIQIVFALSHSASCQTEMESENFRDFHLNLTRRPYNITKIANVLRSKAIFDQKSNNSSGKTNGSNEFEMKEMKQTPLGIKLASTSANNTASEIHAMVQEEQKKMESSPSFKPFESPMGTFSPTFEKVQFTPKIQTEDEIEEVQPLIQNQEQRLKVEDNEEKEKEESRQLVILIVEDDKTNQKVLQLMLKRIPDVSYEIANNGAEGVERYKERKLLGKKYDCIFMDSQMPVMDGGQATQEIRRLEEEDESIGKTYVTALTANALMDETNHHFRVLVDDYLTKPITFKTFSDKIEWIRSQRTD